jgi:aspartate dehydrogenase
MSLSPKISSRVTRLGIIGAGRIARAVMDSIRSGEAGDYEVCSVLARRPADRTGIDAPLTTSRAEFLSSAPDLIIEAAGPPALAEHGVDAIAVADIWSISGMALADADFARRIEAAGRQSGHRLRLVGGAIAGLDAAAIAARDPKARIRVEAITDDASVGTPSFVGSAREAMAQLHGVNVVAAAAIAGTGLDATDLVFFDRKPGARRYFNIHIDSSVGKYMMSSSPNLSLETGATAVVAASVVTALVQAQQTIWAG